MIQGLTFSKITALAAADAVNPCALAVLSLVLIAILTVNPKNRNRVLLAGLAFTLAVYILYFIYGLIFINLFKTFVESIAGVKLYLYKGLAGLAIILGMLNIKDAIKYKPGGFGTEMPLGMRPKVKKIILRVTSPTGAFFVGIFVTIFLLPCTIGPYIIASGLLSAMDFLKVMPWLLYYNLIFVLPMIVITSIIYIGYAAVESVSGWKDKNIRWLHLVAGLLLLCIGLTMLFGWL